MTTQKPSPNREAVIAAATGTAIGVSAMLAFAGAAPTIVRAPLVVAVVAGGVPLLGALLRSALRREIGADFLAGLAIITSLLLGQFLVAAVVVLMLSGGQALEAYATRRASSVLEALARRNPSVAHRMIDDALVDVPIGEVIPGDTLVILPHELSPVDGIVRAGYGAMDESYLSGEPFLIRKTAGSTVISGAVNGDTALTIEATRKAVDSRFARIVGIVQSAEQRRPRMRRIADRLGGWYTPTAVAIAAIAWFASGDSTRFLAVLVIATPCPLLLAIPIAIIGAISVAAGRGIVIKDAGILERLETCRTAIFDKTGTLTLGRPGLSDVVLLQSAATRREVLAVAASLEQYSKHPLAAAIVATADAEGVPRVEVTEISESPGEGLTGHVGEATVRIIGRRQLTPAQRAALPAVAAGLECVVLIEGEVAALFRFRDVVRADSAAFITHLPRLHGIGRLLLVSGDRESEVRDLGARMQIADVRFEQSPEQKLAIVTAECRRQPTLFVGDGINDAPAMIAATAAIALGVGSDVTSDAAGAVILDGSISRVDELLHIASRTRRIALQSAVGGIALSLIGVGLAAGGWLAPLAGAIAQEVIDVVTVLNALRASWPPREMTDF
ncbi:MAG TPA: heavy metal translocating P-type ATPase [Vicinamibacterales bacterium]|nr:heavy metal translocating P-type ATPase [Vicinamibacterales bacterium]